jgi:hypothetical protein
MARKSMKTFIEQHRADIDLFIKGICSNCQLNDRTRRDWIANNESLYHWARAEGVRV